MRTFTIAVLALCCITSAQGDDEKNDDFKPYRPKLIISKKTTFITEPLDAGGYPDYPAALNKIYGKGVTPQNNANVLIWQAIGPHPDGATMPPKFFDLMGIKQPPERGTYFVSLDKFLIKGRKAVVDDESYKLMSRVAERPWMAKDHPKVAAWLKANEKPLAVIAAAVKRPRYFSPIVPPKTKSGRGSMIGTLLSGVQMNRAIVNALVTRAMLRLGEGKREAAWQDLLTCHRLGVHVGSGATLIEALVAYALVDAASQGHLVMLNHGKLASQTIESHLSELRRLPAIPSMADKIDVGERFFFLDTIMMIDRHGTEFLEPTMIFDPKMHKKPIDWNPALREINLLYDRMAAAMRCQPRSKRQAEINKIVHEVDGRSTESGNLHSFAKHYWKTRSLSKARGLARGDELIALLMPSVQRMQEAADRAEQRRRNLHVAFALAAYRADHGRYPMRLSDLTLKYLRTIPDDLFSGEALIYRAKQDAYLFYSVGVNGKDDGGWETEKSPTADDLVVQAPLPKLQQ